MVKAIDFAVRNVAGGAQHGSVAGDTQGNFIQVGSGDSVSLNLSRASVVGYEQQGGDLLIKLSDGRSIVLSNYFNEQPGDVNHLYVSSEGEITEVIIREGQDGMLAADYGPVGGWDKWSPLDDLRFTQADSISDVALVSNEPAGMAPFVPGLLGLGGMGAIAAGAGVIAVIGGGGGSSDGGGTPDTTPPAVTVTEGTKSVNHVENGADYVNGVVIGGTSEPGATVEVLVNGHTQTTVVDSSGNWTVTFPTTEVDPGEYEIPVVVKATDATGNSTTWNDVLVVDTVPNPINFDAVTGDDKVNFVENSTGLVVTGSSIAGATLDVTLNGVTNTVVVGSDGHWTTTYPTGTLPAGEYTQTITATSTDSNGNTSTSTHTFAVDTETSVVFTGTPGGDGMVNASEAAAGVVLNGTAQAGASVSVAWNGTTLTTTANSSGVWSVTYPASAVTAGTYTSTATATATDSFGNTATATQVVNVDTETSVTVNAGQSGGDDVISGAEAAAGVALTGTAEAGATVVVTLEGVSHTVTANASGVWTATFATYEIRQGTYDSVVSVTSTDTAGNTASTTHDLHIDTETAIAVNVGQAGGDDLVNAVEAAAGLALTGTAEAGATVTVTFEGVTKTVTAGADGTWTAHYSSSEVRSGTYDSTVQVSSVDGVGNTASTTHSLHIDTEIAVAIPVGQAGGDDKVSGAEQAAGLMLNGTADAGATVVVTLEGVSKTVTAASNGTWTANFAASEVRAGTYDSVVTVQATDSAGNSATASHTVHVDTETNVAITVGQAGGDDIISGAEEAVGVALTGTAEAGASVVVTMDGVSHTVIASNAGTWTANFSASEIRSGTYATTATAVAIDALGNTATTSHVVNVDTEVVPFDRASLSTGADAILNAAEATSGLTVTGHVEAGSTVMLKFGSGAQHAATVAADGSWSFTIPAGEIPVGENSVTLTAVATDHVGNVSTLTEQVAVDTIVRNFAGAPVIAGDDILNAAERAAGLTLTGTSEPFSTLVLTLANGAEVTASVGADGLWSATFPTSSLPTGEGTTSVTVTATDVAGNTTSYTDSFAYDTVMPNDPWITNDAGTGNLISGVASAVSPDTLTYHAVAATGAATDLATTAQFDAGVDVNGTNVPSHWAFFTNPVADGSYLVINDTDAAGNEQSTLYLRSTTDVTVDLTREGLQGFDFGTIDLTSSQATLSLTEAQINSLTGADQQMAIRGDADDHVNIAGAVAGGQQVVNGESYTLYTLGTSGASVLVDDDIHVNTGTGV
ncbi:MAG: Ig-like domain-containing protein [Cypionkella sp.]|uniref:Ig-like domain-containing protein n=1 Tax=Cypionkella sp. TaxID=2811411 RepID=UPI002ABB1309|nr:Ig-like domain-containing protein [Cypionkella sp.]MDZ4311959.1 Ig-like domain-containing protein [Cypionkella sp.]